MIKARSIRAARLVFICSLFLLTALALAGRTHGQEKSILVRGDHNYPPYEFLDKNGNPTGFNVELIKTVADVMGLDIEIKLGPWTEVRNQLETGQIDVLAGMYYSEQRSRLINFSVPHSIVTHTLIARKDSSIETLNDLAGKEIVVQDGDIMHDFLKEEDLSVIIVPAQNQVDALKALNAGRYDGALVAKLQGLYFIHTLGLNNLEAKGPSILPMKYCFAVKRGDDVLLAKLNEGLNILNIKGKYGEIHNRWFGVYDEASVLNKMRWYIGWILIALFCLLILTFMWSWTLRKKVNEKTDDLVRELGERKRIEDELLISNTVLKTQQETSIDGILVIDSEGKVVSVNQRFMDMWDMPPGMVKAQTHDSGLRHVTKKVTDPQRFLDRVRYLYEHPEEKSWDEITLLDGATYERYSAPMYSAKNKYYGRVWYFRDITARKRSEEALHESERRYRSLFEAANDAILLIEGERFVDCNAKALEMFGCRRDQIINETPVHFSPFVQPDSQNSDKKARAMISAAYRGAPQFFEWKHRRLNGELFDTEVSLSLVKIQIKPHLLVFIRDITHRKDAERERESLIKQLQQAQKMEAIGTLAGGIAHDFNNILAAIIGYTELALLDIPAESRQYDNLKQSLKASRRARDLVKQILSFSRQERREAKPIILEPIVTEALDMIRAMIPSTIEIRADLHSEAKVVVDPTSTHQVLMNLCANAAHAMRDQGGLLEVGLADVKVDADYAKRVTDLREGDYVKLTVKDTGVGIPPHVMERIFEPFFTTKDRGEGTGMGLSVAHGVVKSCGGCILVSSKTGEGSTFDVFFPVMGMMDAIESASMSAQSPGGAERVLVIGDNGDKSGKLSEDLLIPLGYQVTVANNMAEALELFKEKQNKFELIIADASALKTNGLQAPQKLNDIRPEIPVVLCAGFSANLDESMIKSFGVRAIIRKPILRQELASTIRNLLDGGGAPG